MAKPLPLSGATGGNTLFGWPFWLLDCHHGKPFPDLFLHAAQTMRAGFDRCVVIEDSATGVMAAVAAGMCCVALCRAEEAVGMAALGAEPIHSLLEVPPMLL